MYLVSVNGSADREVDIVGVYRAISMANPKDGVPMGLTPSALMTQLTLPADESMLETSTREAMHRLVWAAAGGEEREHRFPDGTVVRVKSVPGTERTMDQRGIRVGPSQPEGVDVQRTTGVRRADRRR
jgi:hypothetical protein